jgi:predicted CopG family antitoxin
VIQALYQKKRYSTDTVIRSGTGTVSEEEIHTLYSEVVKALYQKKRHRHCIRGCVTGTESEEEVHTL